MAPDNTTVKEKRCTRCGVVSTNFALRINKRPHSWCRDCKREYDKNKSRELKLLAEYTASLRKTPTPKR